MSLAGYLPPLVAQVIMDTKGVAAGVEETKAKITTLEGSFKRLAGVGKVALAGIGFAALGVGYESVKMAMDFDQAMELIHTQAGASQSEVDDLKDKVLALAPAVGIGPEKLAEGLYHIESTGLRGKAALDVLTNAAKLAQIGMADLDDVTYALSGVMAINMKDVHSAADAISFMNATVGMGDMRMSQLAAAIGTGILPSMKSAGLGMVDFSAAIATLADNSVPADEAATRLRMTIALMSAPSLKAQGALKSIGISSTELADDMRKPDGLLVAVEDLKTHLEKAGLTASQQNQVIEEAFGGGRTSGAILTLLEESDKLKSKYEQMGTAAGRAKVTQDAWAKQQAQFKQQLQQLVAQLQAWGVKIGNFLIPKIQELMGWISRHKQLVLDIAIVIGVVLVAAMLAFIGTMIAAAAPVLGVMAVLVVLGVVIYGIVTKWRDAWNWIKRITGDAKDWIVRHADDIGSWFEKLPGRIGKALGGLGSIISDAFRVALDAGISVINEAVHWINNNIIGKVNDISGFFGIPSIPNIPDIPKLDVGGHVLQTGIAVVHKGEDVIPAGRAGGGDIVIHQHLRAPDGRYLSTEVIRYGRTSGVGGQNLFTAKRITGSLTRG